MEGGNVRCTEYGIMCVKKRDSDGETDRQSPGTDKEFLHVAGMETVADKS